MKALVGLALFAACAGKPPPATRYYQLAPPAAAPAQPAGEGVLVIEPLATEGAYDDDRIVYRTSPYRLDYYDYHRWAAAPGSLVAGYLAQALRASGRFRVVTAETAEAGAITLGGRVLALEEVDASSTHWQGHVVLELVARDGRGRVVWSDHFDLAEPMPAQSPEGLAHAITAAMAQVAAKVAPPVGELCDREARAGRGRRDTTSRR